MANMTVNQRNQFERVDLASRPPDPGPQPERGLIAYSVLAALVLGALGYATVVAIDGWAQAVVLGVIMLTAVGAMIAVSPNRRG